MFTALALIILCSAAVFAQTTAFNYQGRFTDSTVAQPTTGTYDFQFALYDTASGGTQQGATVTQTGLQVTNGIFTTTLDFGSAVFTGADRYLEIRVKKPSDGSYTTLTPRQLLTSSPYSIKTLSATTADALSSNCFLCIQNSQLAANSITTSKVANGTVTTSKLSDESVSSLKILNGTIVNEDISTSAAIDGTKITGGTITNLNASNLASGTVPVARLGTNTPTSSTFLRGDNTWQTVSGGGGTTLQLVATNTAAQTINPISTANISFNNSITTPTSGAFNGTSYTAAAGGTYLITVSIGGTNNVAVYPALLLNGNSIAYGVGGNSGNLPVNPGRSTLSEVVSLIAGDVITIQGSTINPSTSANLSTDGTTRLTITKLN